MKETIKVHIIGILVIITGFLMLFMSAIAQGQTVERKGNVFVVSNSNNKGYSNSGYLLQDKETGRMDTIYVSAKGAYFVFKTSKNGKVYRKYLKEVTKQLNPDYYKKDNK